MNFQKWELFSGSPGIMLVVHMRDENRGGTNRFDFRFDQNTMNINYIGMVFPTIYSSTLFFRDS